LAERALLLGIEKEFDADSVDGVDLIVGGGAVLLIFVLPSLQLLLLFWPWLISIVLGFPFPHRLGARRCQSWRS
jgi:hypothetical protein